LRIRLWSVLYAGAGISVIICFALIYIITISGNVDIEWTIWIFFGTALALVVGGFLYESDYKRKHRGEELSKYSDLMEDRA
jgi:hypothetical protein